MIALPRYCLVGVTKHPVKYALRGVARHRHAMGTPQRAFPTRFVFACLLLAVSGCHKKAEQQAAKEEEPDVKVHVEAVRSQRIAEVVTGLGRCEALPQRLAILSVAVEGRVLHTLVQPGEYVKAGQPIVELDAAIARANLKEKQSARDSQEATLKLLDSIPRAEEQKNAKLSIDLASVAVERARTAADRLRPLRQRNDISESVMFEADAALRQAELQLKTAQSQYEVLMLHPRPQAMDEAKSRVAMTETAVATAQSQLDLLTIHSPIDGLLDSLNCQLGQTLAVGTSVGQVVASKQVHAVVWLTVPEAQRVKKGQIAKIRGSDRAAEHAPAEKTDNELQGEVVFVGKVTDPQTGNLPVRILVDNADAKLTLGQIVSATIAVREREVLAAPMSAVHDLGEGPVVNVLRDGKTARLQATTGLKDDGWIEIVGTNLKAGEPVVVEGGYNLPDGTKVGVETESDAKESPDKKSEEKKDTEKKDTQTKEADAAKVKASPATVSAEKDQ